MNALRLATIDAATMTADDARAVAHAAGGWDQLRERSAAYGEPGRVAALAYGIAERLIRDRLPDRVNLAAPSSVADYLALRYSATDRERFGALYLDTRHRLIVEQEQFVGTVNRAAVEPRAILRDGLVAGAVGVIVFHVHPSGDPSPSAEDLAFTRRLAEAGELVGIRLIDHLILGGVGRWVSLRDRGAW